jgi:hypothetical protein
MFDFFDGKYSMDGFLSLDGRLRPSPLPSSWLPLSTESGKRIHSNAWLLATPEN